MYNLFLETYAAKQVRLWCAQSNMTEEETTVLLMKTYNNACEFRKNEPGGFDGYMFTRCVKTGDHQAIDIDIAFEWGRTPEGVEFWRVIYKLKP